MKFLRAHIADKLAAATIVFGLLVTLIGTGAQVLWDKWESEQQLASNITGQIDDTIRAIVAVVEQNREADVQKVIDGLVNDSSEINYASVLLSSGSKYERVEDSDAPPGQLINREFTFPESTWRYGVLEVGSEAVYGPGEMLQKIRSGLLKTGLKVFLVAGFMFYLTQKLVTRHLVSLASQIKEYDIAGSQQRLELNRSNLDGGDELDMLVDGINIMQERGWQAYNDLGRSEQRLLLFFEATEEGILGVEKDGKCSFANDACLRILGLDNYDEVLGGDIRDYFSYQSFNAEHAGSTMLIQEAYQHVAAVESPDGILTRNDGTTSYISLRVYPVFKDGACSGAIAFLRDISRERQLNQERAMLSEAVRQAPIMVVITNPNYEIEYVNPGVLSTTGFSSRELMGKRLDVLVEFEDHLALKQVAEKLAEGKPWQGMVNQRTKYGQKLTVSAILSPIFNSVGGGNNRVCVFKDMTYELELQKQFVNSKKMEAVDRLSSSIAHELGNPLFGVRSVIKDLLDRDNLDAKDKELLSMAFDECKRMNQLVREMRSLDSANEPEVQSHTIREIIEQVLMLTKKSLNQSNVEVVLDLTDDLPPLLVDHKQLVLAMSNIVNNSIDSMSPDGGLFTVRSFVENNKIVICFGDSGEGIPQEHRELIFEPFFSTKPEVEGSGLGLTIAYSIIRGLGGDISVNSEVGQGTIIYVRLPVDQ